MKYKNKMYFSRRRRVRGEKFKKELKKIFWCFDRLTMNGTAKDEAIFTLRRPVRPELVERMNGER